MCCENNKTITIAFWNLKDHELSSYICELIKENNIDIMILAEAEKINPQEIETNLNNYKLHFGYKDKHYVYFFVKSEIRIEQMQEGNRFLMMTCVKNNFKFNIMGLHLQSKTKNQDFSREETIRDILNHIGTYENDEPKSVILGDFNLTPYEDPMVNFGLFHSILFKDLMEREFTTCGGRTYQKFYNPTYTIVSEENKTYGSYYTKDRETIHWLFLDQCLMRKSMIKFFKEIKVIKEIGDQPLMKNNKPNINISDHLPLLVKFEEEKNG